MIIIELIAICAMNQCPEISNDMIAKSDAFLERELNTSVTIVVSEPLHAERPFSMNPMILTAFNKTTRVLNNTRVHYSKEPRHIYGFVVNQSQYWGFADAYRDNNSFYVNTNVKGYDSSKTLVHEVLHLFGFAHNDDPTDIMSEGISCPELDVMDCTNHVKNRL